MNYNEDVFIPQDDPADFQRVPGAFNIYCIFVLVEKTANACFYVLYESRNIHDTTCWLYKLPHFGSYSRSP